MFANSLGQQFASETIIFPLITFFPDSQTFKCLGTGFFITPQGGFITAKHVFFQNDGSHVPTLFGIQTLDSGERITRLVVNFIAHRNADIAIGTLGGDPFEISREMPLVAPLMISTKTLNVGDEIMTFAYPSTKTSFPSDTKTQFNFSGKWTKGNVIDYHPDGMSLLRNSCYQTSMNIEDGASGGPVFKNSCVVGINSTGMEVEPGEEPISAITPISFVNDMIIPTVEGPLSMKTLIDRGAIYSDKDV